MCYGQANCSLGLLPLFLLGQCQSKKEPCFVIIRIEIRGRKRSFLRSIETPQLNAGAGQKASRGLFMAWTLGKFHCPPRHIGPISAVNGRLDVLPQDFCDAVFLWRGWGRRFGSIRRESTGVEHAAVEQAIASLANLVELLFQEFLERRVASRFGVFVGVVLVEEFYGTSLYLVASRGVAQLK